MKLKDLTETQVVETTKENHEAFMKLLDKEGFKWTHGERYVDDHTLNEYKHERCYNIKKGIFDSKKNCLEKGKEIIPASRFLKPSKKELLERIEKLEEVVNKPITFTPEPLTPDQEKEIVETMKKNRIPFFIDPHKPTELKPGDLCAFTDDENSFNSKNLIIRELKYIDESSNFKYRDSRGTGWRYARKVEIVWK